MSARPSYSLAVAPPWAQERSQLIADLSSAHETARRFQDKAKAFQVHLNEREAAWRVDRSALQQRLEAFAVRIGELQLIVSQLQTSTASAVAANVDHVMLQEFRAENERLRHRLTSYERTVQSLRAASSGNLQLRARRPSLGLGASRGSDAWTDLGASRSSRAATPTRLQSMVRSLQDELDETRSARDEAARLLVEVSCEARRDAALVRHLSGRLSRYEEVRITPALAAEAQQGVAEYVRGFESRYSASSQQQGHANDDLHHDGGGGHGAHDERGLVSLAAAAQAPRTPVVRQPTAPRARTPLSTSSSRRQDAPRSQSKPAASKSRLASTSGATRNSSAAGAIHAKPAPPPTIPPPYRRPAAPGRHPQPVFNHAEGPPSSSLLQPNAVSLAVPQQTSNPSAVPDVPGSDGYTDLVLLAQRLAEGSLDPDQLGEEGAKQLFARLLQVAGAHQHPPVVSGLAGADHFAETSRATIKVASVVMKPRGDDDRGVASVGDAVVRPGAVTATRTLPQVHASSLHVVSNQNSTQAVSGMVAPASSVVGPLPAYMQTAGPTSGNVGAPFQLPSWLTRAPASEPQPSLDQRAKQPLAAGAAAGSNAAQAPLAGRLVVRDAAVDGTERHFGAVD